MLTCTANFPLLQNTPHQCYLVVRGSIGRGTGPSILTRVVVTVPRVQIAVLPCKIWGGITLVINSCRALYYVIVKLIHLHWSYSEHVSKAVFSERCCTVTMETTLIT